MPKTKMNTKRLYTAMPAVACGLAPVPRDAIVHKKATGGVSSQLLKHEFLAKNLLIELEKKRNENEQLGLSVQKMAADTIKTMENDRKAVAMDIHDSIGGTLAAIKLFMELLMDHRSNNNSRLTVEDRMQIKQLIIHLNEAIDETKRICHQLGSRELEDFTLTVAVSKLIQRFNQFLPKIEVDYELNGFDDGVSDIVKTAIYRVVQEALNNVGKHSEANAAKIKLTGFYDRILLEVKDNGCGFDVHLLAMDHSNAGFGMCGMRDRIELCGGTFLVQSKPGKGTRLSAIIPIR